MKRAGKLRLIVIITVLAFGLTITALASCYTESLILAPLCLFPYLLGAILGGTAHTPSLVGFIIGLVLEWGLIGYLLSGLICLFVRD